METKKTKVLLFQTDNRPELDYLGLTKKVNINTVEYLNKTEEKDNIDYEYLFILMHEKYYENIHPACGKINVVLDLLNGKIGTSDEDIIVFLDSDAWIQNPNYFHELIKKLLEAGPDKQGCFSRDPYVKRADFINSGSFIIRNNDYNRILYKEIQSEMYKDNSRHTSWSYDQYYIGNEIFKRKDDYLIFIPHIINTPEGQIIRHHWYKTHSMYADLYDLVDINKTYNKNTEPYDFSDKFDDKPYPNPNINDYEYIR